MRSTVLIASSIAILAALAGVGCNNTTPPRLYGIMAWKMRCPNPTNLPAGCSMGCTEGMDRSINGFTGEGASVSCNVSETADTRILNFTLQSAAGYNVTFQNVTVPHDGGSALSGLVRFRDDNDYSGAAGGSTPTSAQPCQVSNVRFFRDPESGDPTVEGEVYCETMRSDANMMLCRGLSASGGASAAMMPAQFTLFGCRGLTLPAG